MSRGSLVSDIPAGDGKLVNRFLRCSIVPDPLPARAARTTTTTSEGGTRQNAWSNTGDWRNYGGATGVRTIEYVDYGYNSTRTVPIVTGTVRTEANRGGEDSGTVTGGLRAVPASSQKLQCSCNF